MTDLATHLVIPDDLMTLLRDQRRLFKINPFFNTLLGDPQGSTISRITRLASPIMMKKGQIVVSEGSLWAGRTGFGTAVTLTSGNIFHR